MIEPCPAIGTSKSGEHMRHVPAKGPLACPTMRRNACSLPSLLHTTSSRSERKCLPSHLGSDDKKPVHGSQKEVPGLSIPHPDPTAGAARLGLRLPAHLIGLQMVGRMAPPAAPAVGRAAPRPPARAPAAGAPCAGRRRIHLRRARSVLEAGGAWSVHWSLPNRRRSARSTGPRRCSRNSQRRSPGSHTPPASRIMSSTSLGTAR